MWSGLLTKIKCAFASSPSLGKFLNSEYKKLRAKQFAKENIGHPNLIAASIIAESFTRFGVSKSSFNLLSYILPEITISTDEATLYDIASKVTNIKAVSNTYYILFDRNLHEDITKGLSNTEAQRFWKILNSPLVNQDNATMYGVGLTLFSAVKGKLTRVNKAFKNESGKWEGTNNSYGNFKTGEAIGVVVANGVFTHVKGDKKGQKENYYIVKDCLVDFLNWKCDYGVVLQHQVVDN